MSNMNETQRRAAFETIWAALNAFKADEIDLIERNALTEPARAALRISGGMVDGLAREADHPEFDGPHAVYFVSIERSFFDKTRANFHPECRGDAVQAFADACCNPANDDCAVYLCYYAGGCIDPAIKFKRGRLTAA